MPTRWVGIFLSWHMGFMGRLLMFSILKHNEAMFLSSLQNTNSFNNGNIMKGKFNTFAKIHIEVTDTG